ncbi:MAG: hypothetical protein AAF203_05535, partial [Pseudomonadota bacterium]
MKFLAQTSLILVFLLISKGSYGTFGSIVDVGAAGDLYLNNESANNGQGFVDILMDLKAYENQVWENQLHVDIGAGGLIGESTSSYIKMPEFFFRLGRKSDPHIIVGRAREDWSHADDFWNLGLTQPNFNWDEALS